MRWYYLSETQETIPTSEEQLPILAAQGLVRATTPLWHVGLDAWTSASEVKPALFTGPPPLPQQRKAAPHRIAAGIAQNAVWGQIAGWGLLFIGVGKTIGELFSTFKILAIQQALPQLGPEATLAMAKIHGSKLTTPAAVLILDSLFVVICLLFLFLAGLRIVAGCSACRKAYQDGQTWQMELGLNRLGKALFWLGLAVTTFYIGKGVMALLEFVNFGTSLSV